MTPNWTIDLIKSNFKRRFYIAKLSKLPIIGSFIDWIFFEEDDLIYLPKDSVVLEINQEIPFINIVMPSQIVHHFIDKANEHFIMEKCICRDSNQCIEYPIEIGCLFMGEAAAKIDNRLGKLVTKEEAHKHIIKAGEAGLVHLIGRNKLDSIWLKTGPNEKLLTVCNCCTCCCLWKMLPNLGSHISNKITGMMGVKVSVIDNCVGCGACQEVCFINAITISNGKATISDQCRCCGRCVEVCPQKAIEIKVDPKSYENTIDKISFKVIL